MSKLINEFPIEKGFLHELNKFQKVHKYYGGYSVFHKDTLYKFYSELKTLFFEDFNYMPETYIYPKQKNIIYDKFKAYNLSIKDLWLVKPLNECSGKGITILNSLEKITLKEFIITKYVINLNLIKGKKYDLRLYVLISGLKPLRIYFYKEGCARIASEKFNLNESSVKNKYIHLTNICVNIDNKKYIKPNSTNDDGANIYNIFMYQNFLKSINIEWSDIREKIKDIIIKSIISVYRNLTEENDRLNLSDQSFFNLLGFDILITDNFEPLLVEINNNPTMIVYNNLERPDKTNLFIDTLNLIGIIPFSRKAKEPQDNILFNKEIDDNVNNALCELERPRGGYELIFPKKDNILMYHKYFIYNTEENKKFWSKLNL